MQLFLIHNFLKQNQLYTNKQYQSKTDEGNLKQITRLPQNSLNEVLGRSQINFGAADKPSKELSDADKIFLNGIYDTFRTDKSKEKEINDYTIKFLKKEKVKSLSAFKSDDPFEYSNEIAVYTENIGKILDLGFEEEMTLSMLLIDHINTGDITRPIDASGHSIVDNSKYTMDYLPVKTVLEKYVDEEQVNKIYNEISKDAFYTKCDSIFDLFTKENMQLGKVLFDVTAEKMEIDKDTRGDILIDLYKMAKLPENERLKGINKHAVEEKFEDSMRTIPITHYICDAFNIEVTEELLEMMDSRKTSSEANKNGVPIAEIAYKIADKYNLPSGAEKEIANIVEIYDSIGDEKKIMQELVKALKKRND